MVETCLVLSGWGPPARQGTQCLSPLGLDASAGPGIDTSSYLGLRMGPEGLTAFCTLDLHPRPYDCSKARGRGQRAICFSPGYFQTLGLAEPTPY